MRRRHALVGVVAAQAVENEIEDFVKLGKRGATYVRNSIGIRARSACCCGSGFSLLVLLSALCKRDSIQCLIKQPAHIHIKPTLDHRPRQPQRIAPQRERIFVAGRLQPRGEAAGQRIQTLGDRQHLAQL